MRRQKKNIRPQMAHRPSTIPKPSPALAPPDMPPEVAGSATDDSLAGEMAAVDVDEGKSVVDESNEVDSVEVGMMVDESELDEDEDEDEDDSDLSDEEEDTVDDADEDRDSEVVESGEGRVDVGSSSSSSSEL